jgi:hypothetical protein
MELREIDNRLTDSAGVVSHTPRPSKKLLGTYLCYRLSLSQGHIVAGRIT